MSSTLPEPYEEHGAPLDTLPAPEPVPDTAAYLAEREKALAFTPERRANYQRYLASRRRSADVDYLPIRLDFENVSRCNFRCTMCEVSEWRKGQRAADMSFEDFRGVIDSQHGLLEVKIQGLGEPTMQGDTFFRMIEYARARALWVRTTTNASLLHLKDNYRKLIDSDVNEVQISIDGADKATFESIRKGSKFERVVKNCKLLHQYARERGLERTKMWTVVQKANRHQLAQLVDLAAEMGFRSMAFSLNIMDFGLELWRLRNSAISVEHTFTVAEGRSLIERGKAQGVKVAFWCGARKYRTDKPEHLCAWPFERGYVASDMRIVPCCIIGNPDVAELGSAANFTDAWNSAGWREFRQAHLDGRIPAFCLSCYERTGK